MADGTAHYAEKVGDTQQKGKPFFRRNSVQKRNSAHLKKKKDIWLYKHVDEALKNSEALQEKYTNRECHSISS